MQFTVTKSELLGALNVVNKVIPNSIIRPILNNFLFNVSGESCDVCASNLEVFIQKNIAVTNNDEVFSISIPAARLIGLVKELPEQPLLFEFAADQVQIKSLSGAYIFPTEAGEDFPYFDVTEAPMFVTLSGKDLLHATAKTIFAIDPKLENKTAGLCLDFDALGTTFTGASRALLSTTTIGKPNKVEKRIVMPQKAAEVIAGMPAVENVIVEVREKNISFEMNDTIVRSSLIESNFVDWQRVIPIDNPNLISVDRLMLLGSLKRVNMFTNGESIVKITIAQGSLSIKGEDKDFAQSAVEELGTQYQGDDILVGVRGDLLVEILQNNAGEEINFFMKDGKTAVLIREDAGAKSPSNLMLLMPYI